MKFRVGMLVTVIDSRKGTYDGVVTKAFDTDKDEWFSIALDQDKPINGASQWNVWERGDEIPARNCLCLVKKRKRNRIVLTR